MVATVIGITVTVVVAYAIRYHQRKDARRTEEWKEHVAALRAVLVDLTAIEKTLRQLSFRLLDQEAHDTLGRLKALTDQLNEKANDPRLRTKVREALAKSAFVVDASTVLVVQLPGPTDLQIALDGWKRTDNTERLHQVMTDMIDSAPYRRCAVETLKERCNQLREQVESLIKAAK